MLKEKILKVLTATACITTLIMPHTSVVLAAALTNENPNETNTVTLMDSPYHEQGYMYAVKSGDKSTKILKIFNVADKGANNEIQYSDAFYCLDARKSFPSGMSEENGISYSRSIADFFDIDLDQTTLSNLNIEDYNSLCWLLNNLYLNKQMSEEQREEQRDQLLENAFSDLLNDTTVEDVTTLEDIKDKVNDDDIEMIQQWAIWYFTNNKENNNTTVQEVPIINKDQGGKPVLPLIDSTKLPYNEENLDAMDGDKYKLLTILYQYFIEKAEANKNTEFTTSTSHPTIEGTNATIIEDGTNYKAGPFKVTVPTGCSDDYNIKITDGTNEISNYTINGTTSNTITAGEEFYVYVSKSSNISKVKVSLTYYATKASVWTPTDANRTDYQPMVLVTREGTDTSVEANLSINPDLALRKYIVKVNDTEITDRKPQIKFNNGKIEYWHKKSPVELKVGDTVTYEITVYNEGNVEGMPTEVVDYLPDGLEFIADNETNRQYGWTANGKVITAPLNKNLQPFANNSIDSVSVQIVCKVANATSGAVLTNIAEIKADNIDDIDSTPDSLNSTINSIDESTYTGKNNKLDLSDTNYYYKGYEDDDDFEKVVVAGKPFDLSLQKFITKVNGKEVESREPKVDVTPLKNGSTNAKYETVKIPVLVQTGDIVTYKIRVYNEGEVDGYAENVADYLPEGLGYLVNYNDNINNYWAIPQDAGTKIVKLSEVSNGTKNLKVDNFTGVTDLNNVDVVKGAVKLTSTALSSSNSDNLIKAFDGSDKLSYKDIEVTCIVLSDSNLKNVAEVTKNLDSDKNEVTDRDSIPDTVDPNNYPGNDENQDDNDYETLTMKKFDLALQKFITGLNDKEITDRVPKATYADGKITYEHPDTALEVNNGDNVTYTIRVYNEGEVDGYAAEIGDDIPNGLVFDSNNETNKKYGWVMLDSSGNVTTDTSKAVEIRTDYLSKEKSEARGESAVLKALELNTGNLSFFDVKAVFKVNTTSTDSNIINTAEITKNTDTDGKDIEDIDSTPNNKKEDEDDLDKEKVHVGYFDLALKKDLSKAIVTEGNSTKEIPAVNGQLMKVEIHRKKINSTIVKFAYNITITNEGTIPGYAKEIKDYIPEGLQFVEADNQNWKASSEGTITTEALADKLLQPGESASVEVVLRWINNENNMGMKTNVAEISKDYNDAGDTDDIDSTPDNKKDGEDDIDDAPVMLSISTGRAPMYIILTTGVLTIISTGVVMIKKYVL